VFSFFLIEAILQHRGAHKWGLLLTVPLTLQVAAADVIE
jgi:hypothetical protein